MLQVTPVRAFSDNYIWLIHSPRDPSQVVAVDPGEAAPVERTLADRALSLSGLLITHHHPDHVGGVPELTAQRRIATFAPANERTPGDAVRVREGDPAYFPELGLAFSVLDVPGHTAGHIAFVGHGAVFCGDTLFSGGCGRLFEGTAEQMSKSLGKLAALPPDTLVYCAHEYTISNLRFELAVEPDNAQAAAYLEECRGKRERDEPTVPTTMRRERTVNPFLRCDQESVRRAAEARAGRRLQNQAEIFAVVREWKDGFR
ncbi:MAG TPA: hydroxyacylglutathione hydrolase [Steroidobacter sp.]|nr:hydroxyacylglutathione hydrolase [Steroidobacter sp.]